MKVCPLSISRKRETTHSGGESEDEVGATIWGTFKPVASKRVENPYPAKVPFPGVVLSAAAGVTSSWSQVGKLNAKPVKLTQKGIHDIFYRLLNVHMVPSAGKAVAGDAVCIGLTFKLSPFVHPKTQRNRELIEAVVAEVRSHKELKDV